MHEICRLHIIEAGAISANNPQELIENCDVVLTMVSNDDAVKEIFEY